MIHPTFHRLRAASLTLCCAAFISASPVIADDGVKQMAEGVAVATDAQAAAEAVESVVVEVEDASVQETSVDARHAKVTEAFQVRLPNVPIDSISDAAMPGLYEVVTDSQVIYVNETVTLLFQGEMIDLDRGVNLTETRQSGIHMGLINDLGEDKMLVYKSKTPSDRTVTVFTDINCGYCRKLHAEIDTLLEAGVNVRYLMFPRAGLESESRVALESVWCSDDPQTAMTDAKSGIPISPISCDTPVEEHYKLAEQVGLRGTPLIYLDNGTSIPGYREAKVLVEMINSTEPLAN